MRMGISTHTSQIKMNDASWAASFSSRRLTVGSAFPSAVSNMPPRKAKAPTKAKAASAKSAGNADASAAKKAKIASQDCNNSYTAKLEQAKQKVFGHATFVDLHQVCTTRAHTHRHTHSQAAHMFETCM